MTGTVPAQIQTQASTNIIKIRTGWRVSKVVFHIATGFFLLFASAAIIWHHTPAQRAATRWWHKRLLKILNIELNVIAETELVFPALFVSNHISWLDIPVIGSILPTYFLSKEEVRKWPLIGTLAAGAGTLFIQRGNGKTHLAADTLTAHIKNGRSVLFFPEGTTTDGASIKTYHHKLFACVKDDSNAMHAISLRYFDADGSHSVIAPFIGDDDFVGHLLRLLKQDKVWVEVRLSAPQYREQKDDRRVAQSLLQITHQLRGRPNFCKDER